jgi:hypothetical protein
MKSYRLVSGWDSIPSHFFFLIKVFFECYHFRNHQKLDSSGLERTLLMTIIILILLFSVTVITGISGFPSWVLTLVLSLVVLSTYYLLVCIGLQNTRLLETSKCPTRKRTNTGTSEVRPSEGKGLGNNSLYSVLKYIRSITLSQRWGVWLSICLFLFQVRRKHEWLCHF